jgi:CRISPR-associated protein (TIGR02584 family)
MSVDPLRPESYPCRILLAVTGLAPQVVTENLYFLCCVRRPSFIPTEVRVIATARGRDSAELGLLHDQQGQYWRFLKDYGLEGQIAFDSSHIHTLVGCDGQPLEDLRTEADLAIAADTIISLVRTLTADPDCALHVSITGGRNAIGVYLGMAMSLYGRPQDRLSQVLVAPEFLSNHDFYYPPPRAQVLVGSGNALISTADAGVSVAEIPFVSLRHGLPENLLTGDASYMDTVAAARRSFSPARLEIHFSKRSLVCGDREVTLPPQPFAWYAWMSQRRKTFQEYGGHVGWRDDGISEEFLGVYRNVVGSMTHDYEDAARVLAQGMTKEFFDEKKSKVNRWLREELGLGAEPYLIQASGRRPTKRFGLSVPPNQIHVLNDQ